MAKKHYMKPKRSNPEIGRQHTENRIKEAMNESRDIGIQYASLVYNIVIAHVLHDKTDLNDEQIHGVIAHIANAFDSILGDYMTIPDIIKTLKEENNFTLDEKKLIEFYPELEGYLNSDK